MRFLYLLMIALLAGVNSCMSDTCNFAGKENESAAITSMVCDDVVRTCHFCHLLCKDPEGAYPENIIIKIHENCTNTSAQMEACHLRCLMKYFEYTSFDCPFCATSLWLCAVELCKELAMHGFMPELWPACLPFKLRGPAHGQKLLAAIRTWMPVKAPHILAHAAVLLSRSLESFDNHTMRFVKKKYKRRAADGECFLIMFHREEETAHKQIISMCLEQCTLVFANRWAYNEFYAQLTLFFISAIMKCSEREWACSGTTPRKAPNRKILEVFQAFHNDNLLKDLGCTGNLPKITPFYRAQKTFMAYAAACAGFADLIFPVLQSAFGINPLVLLRGAVQAIAVFGERKRCPQSLRAAIQNIVKCVVSDVAAYNSISNKHCQDIYDSPLLVASSELYNTAVTLMLCGDTAQAGFRLLFCARDLIARSRNKPISPLKMSTQYIIWFIPHALQHGNENLKVFLKTLLARLIYEDHLDGLSMITESYSACHSGGMGSAYEQAIPRMVEDMKFALYTCTELLHITLSVIAKRPYIAPRFIAILPPAFFFSPEFCFALWAGRIPLALVAEYAPRDVHPTQFLLQGSAIYHGYYQLLHDTLIDFESDVEALIASVDDSSLTDTTRITEREALLGLGMGEICRASIARAKSGDACRDRRECEPGDAPDRLRLLSLQAEEREYSAVERYLSRVPMRAIENFRRELLGTLIDLLVHRPHLQARVLWCLRDSELLDAVIAQNAENEERFKRVLVDVFVDEVERRAASIAKKQKEADAFSLINYPVDTFSATINSYFPVSLRLLYVSPLFHLVSAELIERFGPDSALRPVGQELLRVSITEESAPDAYDS